MAVDRVGKGSPASFFQVCGYGLLHEEGIAPVLDPQSERYTEDVGIDDDARLSEARRKDEVGRFSANTR